MKARGIAYQRPARYEDIAMPKNSAFGVVIGGLEPSCSASRWCGTSGGSPALEASSLIVLTLIVRSSNDDTEYLLAGERGRKNRNARFQEMARAPRSAEAPRRSPRFRARHCRSAPHDRGGADVDGGPGDAIRRALRREGVRLLDLSDDGRDHLRAVVRDLCRHGRRNRRRADRPRPVRSAADVRRDAAAAVQQRDVRLRDAGGRGAQEHRWRFYCCC